MPPPVVFCTKNDLLWNLRLGWTTNSKVFFSISSCHFSIKCLSLQKTPSHGKGTQEVLMTQVGGGGIMKDTRSRSPSPSNPLLCRNPRNSSSDLEYLPPVDERMTRNIQNFFSFHHLPEEGVLKPEEDVDGVTLPEDCLEDLGPGCLEASDLCADGEKCSFFVDILASFSKVTDLFTACLGIVPTNWNKELSSNSQKTQTTYCP